MGKKYTILFIIVTLRENIMEKIKPVIICMTPVTLKSKGYWLTDWKVILLFRTWDYPVLYPVPC